MAQQGSALPEHLVDQIRRLRRSGLSVRAIAEAVGVSRSTVERYLDREEEGE